MRRYITKILLFFLLVAALDFVFGKVCNYMFSHPKGGETKALQYLVNDCDKDILIMGSSRAHCHYDDKMIEDSLGISCYNAGVEGNGIIMMYGLYKLMKHKPKIIIYDLEPSFDLMEYAEDQNNTRYVSILKFFSSKEVDDILQTLSPMLALKNKSSLYRYNARFITVAKDYLKGAPVGRYGFAPAQGEMSEEPIQAEVKQVKVDSTKYSFFERFIECTKKDGVNLLVVASPKYGFDGGSLEPIKSLCSQNDIRFLDYSNDERFQRLDYFKEPMHMNMKGAILYSSIISKTIMEYVFIK